MKKLYPKVITLCFSLIAFLPPKISAQCNCAPGVPATPIVQSITIAPTTASSLTYSFLQFDPSIGTLSCVTLKDTINGNSTSGAANTGARSDPPGYVPPMPGDHYTGPPVASDSTIFKFQLNLTNDVSGPGIDLSYDFQKNYGPDTLSYTGTPGDTVTYGPDNIITNPTSIASTGGNAAYIGAGHVNFFYTINGGMIDTKGGPNYRTKVTTVFGGTLNLTYYWCPAAVLANNITNFTAFKKNNYIQLYWKDESMQDNVSYVVEYSTNGSAFLPVGSVQSGAIDAHSADAGSFQYLYQLTVPLTGKLFFRIKRTGPDGKTTFTYVKTVNLEAAGMAGYQAYPNPVTNRVMLEFDEMQTGNFTIALVNTTGQVIQQKQVMLAGNNQIRLDLDNHPAAGVYYLQARDQTHNQQYITKLLIK